MANTHDRRIINPTIRFRYDLDPIDAGKSPGPPPVKNGSQHYLDPLAPFQRRTSSQPTYVLHVKRRITARVVAIARHAVFFAILPAPASRRPNPQASARGYANAVCSRNMHTFFPTAVNCTFYEQTSAERARAPDELLQLR